jgi:hypothetical protein
VLGPYALQAIAASRASARNSRHRWACIVAFRDALAALLASPVVLLNRAVAVGMVRPGGLSLVDELRDEPALASYHLLQAVRGDLLVKLGRRGSRRVRRRPPTQNARERELLTRRALACTTGGLSSAGIDRGFPASAGALRRLHGLVEEPTPGRSRDSTAARRDLRVTFHEHADAQALATR